MSYYVMWKGEETGPFSSAELKEMLVLGKVGMLHKIRADNTQNWVYLKDFDIRILDIDNTPAEPQKKRSSVKNNSGVMQYFVYTAAGLAFLSIYFYFVALVLSFIAFIQKDNRTAALGTSLSTGVYVLGIIFFKVIYPVLEA